MIQVIFGYCRHVGEGSDLVGVRTRTDGRLCVQGTVYALNQVLSCKLEVWEWVVKRRIFDTIFRIPRIILCICIYGPSEWASFMVPPLSLVVALWFVASVPASYLAGVIAYPDEDSLAPSFKRHPASKQATSTSKYNLQAFAKHLV